MLNNRVESYKDLISKVVSIDEELVQAIQNSKNKLTSSFHMSSLSPNIQNTIDDIYKKKSPHISGQEGKTLFENMQRINLSSKDLTSRLVEGYREEVCKMIANVADLKDRILTDYLSQFTLNSVILRAGDEESRSELEYLRQTLNLPTKMELLYRGSENGFRAAAFHDKCGEVENTLTLVLT